jgi:hypothetical protein
MFVSNMFEKLMELGLKLSIPLSLFFLVIYIFHNIDLCIFFFFLMLVLFIVERTGWNFERLCWT